MFQLTKVWIDPRPGFENVEIRYKWSPLGETVTFPCPALERYIPPVARAAAGS